jgi:hypothetical protein
MATVGRRAGYGRRRANVVAPGRTLQVHVQARDRRRAGGGVLGIGAGRVVALLARCCQLTSSQAWCRSRSGALNMHLASRQTCIRTAHAAQRSGLADDVAVAGSGRARAACRITASRSAAHLQHHAQLFVEQGLAA